MHHLSNCVHEIASDFIPSSALLFYHQLEFLFKTLSNKHEDICWTSFSHAHTHTRALRVIDARQNIRETLCGHVIRVSYGQSDFWGPTKVERSYPSAIMSRLSPNESDVAKWPQSESLILLAKCHRSSPHFRIALSHSYHNHSYHSLSLARRKRHKAKPKITIYTTSIICHSPSLNQTLVTKVLYQLKHLFTVFCAPLCLPPIRRKNPGCQSCATS